MLATGLISQRRKAILVYSVVSLALFMLADIGESSMPAWIFIVWLLFVAVGVWINWRITQKAGFPGWYSLGLIVPFLNLILILLFAFSEWPIEREVKLLRGLAMRKTPVPR